MKINIIIPVLNEEKRLEKGVITAVNFLNEKMKNQYMITIIDNGSTDKTEEIATRLKKNYDQVEYIRLNKKGVGVALREGVKNNNCEIIGYMDVDLSTDIEHLLDVYKMFKTNSKVCIINGSRNSVGSHVTGRRKLRKFTSYTLSFIIRNVLRVSLQDYMCGFKFFRNDEVKKLIEVCGDNDGWFYCAELLIKAEWMNEEIIEIPVRWQDDRENSKVESKIIKISCGYLKEIFKMISQRKKIVRGR